MPGILPRVATNHAPRRRVPRALLLLLATACAAPTPTATPSASGTDPGQLPWFQVEATESREQDDVLAALTLRVGYVDGTTTAEFALPVRLEQRIPPIGLGFITSDGNGRVAFSTDDGQQSTIQLIDVASGTSRAILKTDRPLLAGLLHPDGAILYLVAADRASGTQAELFSLDLEAPDAQPMPLDPAWLGDPTLAANEGFTLLHLTPDGTRLIVQRCPADSCSYRIIRLATGEVSVVEPPGTGALLGITNQALLAHPSSWGMTKAFVFVSMDGEVADLELVGSAATLVAAPDGPRVVLATGDLGSADVDPDFYEVIDPESGESRPLFPQAGARPPMGPIVSLPETQGLHLPPGWIAFGDEARLSIDGPMDMSPVVLNIATGETIQLSNLAPIDGP